MSPEDIKRQIFCIEDEDDFRSIALEIFRLQYANTAVYKAYTDSLQIDPSAIKDIYQIPFLPVDFFKRFPLVSGKMIPEFFFQSSGTGSGARSKHYLTDLTLYETSFG
jgi:hypothetical protein